MRRSLRSLAGLAGSIAFVTLAAGCMDETRPREDTTAPAAPQALYSVTGDSQVSLYWVNNTEPDFQHYAVWRGDSYDGPYDQIGTTASPVFVDQNVVNGRTYFYAVSAVDQAGNDSELSKENVFDTPRPEGFGVLLVNASSDPTGPSGYDFSSVSRRLSTDPATDVSYTMDGGVGVLATRDADTQIQDAGFHQLDELDWAPLQGWSPTREAEAVAGHAYYVWTRDNHFAKVRVTSLTASQVALDWAYQIDPGNQELAPGVAPKP